MRGKEKHPIKMRGAKNDEERLLAALNSGFSDLFMGVNHQVIVTGKGYDNDRIYLGEIPLTTLYAEDLNPLWAIDHVRFGPLIKRTPKNKRGRIMYDNLPPGCSVNDIPGNRPGDDWDELVWDQVDEEIYQACQKDKSFEAKIESYLDETSRGDDPEWVANDINSRYLEEAQEVLQNES